jgi:soluble lytic murein transglycosylase
MFRALRWRHFIMAGAAVALVAAPSIVIPAVQAIGSKGGDAPLATAAVVPASVPAAVAVTDPVVTGSVKPATTATPDEVTRRPSSVRFLKALEVLASGDEAAAYELARSIPDEVERRTIQWAAIYHSNGEIDHRSVVRFAADAPPFAAGAAFQTRLEQAVVRANAGGAELIEVLGKSEPNMIAARVALATAWFNDGQTERATEMARAIWTENFLDRGTEDLVRKRLGTLLDRDAHWARAVHLMMHDRARGVERIMSLLSEGQQSLATARIAVSRNAKDAKKLLDEVDPAFQSHPVFLFSRAQRARQFELWDDAVDWLDKAGGEVPDAAEWWYERRALTRQLLALDKPELAYRAAAGYTHGPDGRLVDARFHAGWIALSFLDDPEAAAGHFEAMREVSTLPDSVTQSNYWLARARQALGDKAGSEEAFGVAAGYGTVYYGQLARAELGMSGVQLRDMPDWRVSEAQFEARETVRAVHLLADNGQSELATPLLRDLASELKDGGELLLAARLAQSLGAHHLAIAIAGDGERRGLPRDLFSFPKDGLPTIKTASVDTAAVYAVTRQESHFRADAVSGAGARGLMQLMPGTAEETAAKVGVEYSQQRLTSDPAYNALLGSTYLAAQLERYDGSLVLAAAAYNAGAGNANKWIAAHGDPRSDEVDPVVWVERIPFHETRKYVQRVLGNYLVYRARLGHEDVSLAQALRTISS